MEPLAPAHLSWDGDHPWAVDYEDVYYGSEDPQGEVRTVFIDASRLPQRFATTARFALGETGFGTGLNFCLTLATWRECASRDAFLSYLSAEAHPLAPADLARSLRAQGIATGDIETLLAQYPPPLSGMHRIHFPADRVVLTLVYGDAAPALARVQGRVDAWFLDGFAPSRNPALWNLAVFRQLARLSSTGTTLSTFTAAGQVRRDLAEVGFVVQKQPGFSGKRERTTGVFSDAQPTAPAADRIAVVGAGIAGLSTALALRERALRVTLFDHQGVAAQASGNPAALLTPHLSAGDSGRNALALSGMRATQALLEATGATDWGSIVLAHGVEHRGITRHAARRLAHLAASDPGRSGDLFTVLSDGADLPTLFYPGALGIDLGRYCRQLGAGLELRQHAVLSVQSGGDGVTVHADHGPEAFDAVVIATGAGATALAAGQPLPGLVGGQMTRIRTPLAALGNHALTGRGYCLPERDGQHWLGATYRRDRGSAGVRDADNDANIRNLGWVDRALEDPSSVEISDAWYGARAVFRDRLPMVGAMPGPPQGLGHPQMRIFLNLGYGSRGLLYAPLAAQVLADRICGLPEPLPDTLAQRFSPTRFDPAERQDG
ncbi:tRNA (5-methylaminomethyl-2-thiouridine)(34)-methyltransferase MnmD [Thioalkalivibrio sp.]|uniref:tRNA (5-methylaminomethyl-2-thiouridine)(34)-methyltransferase MnmD n=1 Tax=Thioalkalivibrio sp. TaxID=2093813 RepID=UPI00397675E2